jgi:type II secretory pathway component PulF
VVRLVRAGEESGRLAAMLAHAARLEREYAVGRTKALVRLLEPSLILIFGGIVAFVAAALLQALYSIRPGA